MATGTHRERFIPVDKAELVSRSSINGLVPDTQRPVFRLFSDILASIIHFEFHRIIESLKQNYRPFNPDRDTLSVRRHSQKACKTCEERLMAGIKAVLNQANYQQISASDLAFAIDRESLFNISLMVDFNDFENQLVFRRGVQRHRIRRKKGLFREEAVEITVYERVAVIIKYKDEAYFASVKRKGIQFQPGSMIVKLFKNIPKGDLEMLFPNAQVRMKLKDKLLMGGVAVGGGVTVMLKASAGLIAMASVMWLMVRSFIARGGEMPPLGPVEISGMVGGASALAAIGAFLFKQWNSYKNRKIKFMKALGDNLYFKNLDNNVGVFYHIIGDAEEEEFKEALLGYTFLLNADGGMTAADLDAAIESWFQQTFDAPIDFEIDDALEKLQRLELCAQEGSDAAGRPRWQAIPLSDACERLDRLWDNFFQVHGHDATAQRRPGSARPQAPAG